MKRRLCIKMDLLYPDVGKRVTQQQEKQKDTHDNSKALRTFKDGDLVYAENFNSSPRWIPATAIKSNGPLSYLVKTSDGREMRRHVDNLRARYENTKKSGSNTFDSFDPLVFPDVPNSVVNSPPPSPPVTQQSKPEHSKLRRSNSNTSTP